MVLASWPAAATALRLNRCGGLLASSGARRVPVSLLATNGFWLQTVTAGKGWMAFVSMPNAVAVGDVLNNTACVYVYA